MSTGDTRSCLALFLVVGVGVAIRMTMVGLDRDHYFFYNEPPSSWSPAFGLLALFLGFIALECAALVWPTLRFRGRALWTSRTWARVSLPGTASTATCWTTGNTLRTPA